MIDFVVDCLVKRGFEPVLAYYEPYSMTPELSVPSYRLLQRSIGSKQRLSLNGYETHAIGAWLPELEFTHYLATEPWKKLIGACDCHIAVSGSAMALLPFLQKNIPYLGWVATGWAEDRRERVVDFPWPRKILDTVVNGPVIQALEKRILNGGAILALSDYTSRTLDRIAGRLVTRAVMPMPVDTDLFRPSGEEVVKGRIGFSGRIDDPRKNVGLLLRAARKLVDEGLKISVDLIGGELKGETRQIFERSGLLGHVRDIPYMPKDKLAKHLSTLDVFVVPSHQEGLCIAALEAMACGCPVVSTRCGGPEEFVKDEQTGILVDFDANDMAEAIAKIISDRTLRTRLSKSARRLVRQRYNRQAAASIFWENFETAFM